MSQQPDASNSYNQPVLDTTMVTFPGTSPEQLRRTHIDLRTLEVYVNIMLFDMGVRFVLNDKDVKAFADEDGNWFCWTGSFKEHLDPEKHASDLAFLGKIEDRLLSDETVLGNVSRLRKQLNDEG